ncbi:hypothetical protein ACLQ2S_24670 [Micromonospora sp. DT48]|uniref:hypothetical protein n=1 Tax=Micromonospora sp. DT48 TaxID=3393429 RepID=UPI003CEF5DD5
MGDHTPVVLKGYGDAQGRRWCVLVGVEAARAVSAPTMEPPPVQSIKSHWLAGVGCGIAG